jgi:hypothetical protein
MKKFVLIFAVAATPAAASENWNVVEGPLGATKGSWTVMIEGVDLAAQAKMTTARGQPVTYSVTGKIENGVYSLRRQASSDHRDCVYHGERKPDGVISGSALCAGERGPWIARPAAK